MNSSTSKYPMNSLRLNGSLFNRCIESARLCCWLVASGVLILRRHSSSVMIFLCDCRGKEVQSQSSQHTELTAPFPSTFLEEFLSNFLPRSDIALRPAPGCTASATTVTQCLLPVKFLCWSQIGCRPQSGRNMLLFIGACVLGSFVLEMNIPHVAFENTRLPQIEAAFLFSSRQKPCWLLNSTWSCRIKGEISIWLLYCGDI